VAPFEDKALRPVSLTKKFLLCLAVSSLLTANLFSQALTSLRGNVTDAQGAAIPATAVTLTSKDTGATRKVLTDAQGVYQFQQVAPGLYTVKAEKPGFSVNQSNDVRLVVSTPASLDIRLEVGQTTETINVTGEAPALNTVDATIGNAFNETQVRQLPLATRNVVELLSLQAGVTQTGEVLGARRDQNNVTLDGVDVNDNQTSGVSGAGPGNGSNAGGARDAGFNAALPVPLDSVAEFRVTVGGTNANQGRSSGGQVTLITKSGSNQFHGSAYEFNRNTALAANNWFSNRAGIAREALVRNQFGASLGGRVIKDRVFFFGNYERRIDASARGVTRTVPTETLKNGSIRVSASNGQTYTLTPADIRAIDPLGLGFSSTMQQYMAFYPAGNDPNLALDRGLNFSGLRFNAPFRQQDNATVGKMDFILDKASRNTLALRGTMADNAVDQQVAQFPGQPPAAKLLNNSKGLSALLTTVVKPSVINTFTFGLTRIAFEQAGTVGPSIAFDGLSTQQNFANNARGFIRISPTVNLINDTIWTKQKHTIQGGINFRFINNDRSNFINSFPSYSFSRNTLRGLGGDLTPRITEFLRNQTGIANLNVNDSVNLVRAFGTAYGLVNQYSATYQFERDGVALPFGAPAARGFNNREYEFYIQDTWRVRKDLTITAGLRYAYFGVPWESGGTQVATTVPMQQYWAERVGASQFGIPGRVLPSAVLTYDLNGPVNGKPSWYAPDKNNWAPRVALAYNPDKKDGLFGKILGTGSVFRVGAGVAFDRFGSDLVTEFDRTGSPGLASQVTQPANTDFSTAARFTGGALPALPPAPNARFPFTPATIVGGFNSQVGIASDLRTPYAYLLNASFARQLPGKLTVEVGYVGRMAQKQLMQVDTFQPLTQFKDQRSGQTWAQASGILYDLYLRGITPAQVRANPSLVGSVPFFENMFPGLVNLYQPGNATANYYNALYDQNAGSDLDALNQMDRERSTQFPNCISALGCNTFFPMQNAGNRTWMNVGRSSFHGGTLTVRRALQNGFSFDFNYTLSHSLDYSSAPESGAGNGGAIVQDSFNPRAFRGSSDFDSRHQINANGLYMLPIGKGKKFLSDANGFVNNVLGGWEVSMLMRYRSGLPTTITNGGYYPTNYLTSSIAIIKPGSSAPESGVGFDQRGVPSIFRNTSAINSYVGQYPGTTGTRAILRLAGMTNFDINLAKRFFLPFEGHSLQFRVEAFNAFNNVNFFNPSLSLTTPATFGQFQSAMTPRVVQLALRYEF
jgi:hypothetical protein